jgi:4-diphosphocytidyl-2-C-methyl-D-erythritol kinase
MRLLCPAKINLHLRVGPRRADGFHSLLSWFVTTSLFDTLTLEPANTSPAPSGGSVLSLVCDQADLPCDDRNLVVKVANAFAEEVPGIGGRRVGEIRAMLNKRIPAGAGLGGGSSDGARALLGLNALWKSGRPAKFLSEFAGRFGSDLPFFLHGPSSICSGRGEIVRPIAPPAAKWAVLILPPIHMPTADVYRKFDAMGLGRNEDIEQEPDWNAWSKLGAVELLGKLVNDLEPPAFAISPELAAFREKIEQWAKRPVRMSGSGSSLFTFFDTLEEAEGAEANLTRVAGFARVERIELAPDLIDDLSTESPHVR